MNKFEIGAMRSGATTVERRMQNELSLFLRQSSQSNVNYLHNLFAIGLINYKKCIFGFI